MTEAFYLTATSSLSGTWYMLLIRRTHFCISCGTDLDKILQVLKSYVKDYRNEQRLLTAMDNLDYGGRVSPATFEQREEYYKEHGEDYEDLVESTVLEALAEAREEDKANNPLRKARNRLQKAGGIKTPPVKTQEVKPIEVRSAQQAYPKLLRKPKVFNRK